MKKESPWLFAMLELGMNWYDQTYIRRSDVHECLLNVICTFNLRPVSSGWRMEILVCFELSTIENLVAGLKFLLTLVVD